MNDKALQKKIDQLAKLAQELHEEAKRRYGTEAQLFYESAGSFHIMTNDDDASCRERQEHIRFTSNGFCAMGCGAW